MTQIEPGRFTRAAIHNEVGEAELRLSAAGNWQLHLRATEEREWRLACSGGFEEGGVVSASPAEDRRLQIGRLLLDTGARCAFVDGRELPLTPREYALLAMLCADPERVFTVAEIQLRAFSYGAAVTTCRSVAAHASRLRLKLRRAGAGKMVVNCHGVGYRLTDGVELASVA